MSFIENATLKLRNSGYKVTPHRMDLLGIFDNIGKPLNAYELQKVCKDGIDLATIYRILDVFVSLNIVHKIFCIGGYVKCCQSKFESCHHFLVCKECKNTEEINHENCTHKIEISDSHFQVSSHVYEIMGVCHNCTSSVNGLTN